MAELMKTRNNDVNSDLFTSIFDIETKIYNYEALYLIYGNPSLDNYLIKDLKDKKRIVFISSNNDKKEYNVLKKYYEKISEINDISLIDSTVSKYATIKFTRSSDALIFMNDELESLKSFIGDYEIDKFLNDYNGIIIGYDKATQLFKSEELGLTDKDIILKNNEAIRIDRLGNSTLIK